LAERIISNEFAREQRRRIAVAFLANQKDKSKQVSVES
jgi:hypothetical protein